MNRPILTLVGAVLFPSLGCLAEPLDQPLNVQPASVVVPPAAQSAAHTQQGSADADQATVLVLPFASVGANDREWISKGIQQDLAADLIRSSRLRVITPVAAPTAQDAQGAVKAARDAGATFVIFGHFQSVDSNVRITGQVVETATGQSIGALKSTGPARDLFNMEDALTGQVLSSLPKRLLAREMPEAAPMPYVYEPPTTSSQPAPGYTDNSGYYMPQAYSQAPLTYGSSDYAYSPGTYSTYPGDAYYGYTPSTYYPYYYDWWYPGIGFVYFNDFHHHHDHDYGHHDGGSYGGHSHSKVAQRFNGGQTFASPRSATSRMGGGATRGSSSSGGTGGSHVGAGAHGGGGHR